MLTKADDYPIHQTPEPIAYSGSNRNFYDRYFFNGYQKRGDLFFAAALGVVATAVFLIYLSDAIGYGGSIGIVLYKELGQPDISMLEFFRYFSYTTAVVCAAGFAASGAYFMRRSRG